MSPFTTTTSAEGVKTMVIGWTGESRVDGRGAEAEVGAVAGACLGQVELVGVAVEVLHA